MLHKLWELVLVGLVASVLCTTAGAADDKQTAKQRELKAKAALALSATAKPIAIAPQPKESEITMIKIACSVLCEVCKAVCKQIDEYEEPISFRQRRARQALEATCPGPNCPAPGPQLAPAAPAAVVPVVEMSGGCANGTCAAPVQSGGWYPGQRLFRRLR